MALASSVVFSLVTLTRFPILYGDESWIGSAAWSFASGHGFRPSLAVGGGVYDHATDYWLPRLGTLPFIITDAIAGPSFWAFRFAAFVIGVGALMVFVAALRPRYGFATAVFAALALSLSWGFFSAGHYVRWDSLAFLLTCLLLGMFLRGVPGPRGCLLLGLGLGLCPDIEVSVLASFPVVVLLVAWNPVQRFARLGLLAAGMAGGFVTYFALHSFPFGSQASKQFSDVYAPAYKLPVEQILKHHSLAPLRGERLRYDYMAHAYAPDRLAMYVLFLGLAALIVALAVGRLSTAYPTHLVAGFFLAGHLGGLALIQANKAPIHAWYAVPYAIAAIVEAIYLLGRSRSASYAVVRVWTTVLALGLLAALEGHALVDVERMTPKEPIFTKQFAAIARRAAPPGKSVLGDYIYWWGFRNINYHWNSWIWNYRWSHHAGFDPAFNRLCPDVVIFDDVWNSRYDQTATFGPRFPSMAPTDATERAALHALLEREYSLTTQTVIDGRKIQFWTRKAAACRGILTTPTS